MSFLQLIQIASDVFKYTLEFILPLTLAFLAAYYAIKQVRVNNIINARIAWLGILKENIALFISLGINYNNTRIDLVHTRDQIQNPNLNNNGELLEYNRVKLKTLIEKENELLNLMVKTLATVILNLNPNEILHKNLEKTGNGFIKYLREKNYTNTTVVEDDYQKYIDDLFNLSKAILKEEWEIAKSGKISHMLDKDLQIMKKGTLENLRLKYN